MNSRQLIERQYLAVVRMYEDTIRMVGGRFYPEGGYQYRALLCDLTTHLWEVYPKKPSDMDEEGEKAWVYVVLYNKALNLVRNDQLHNSVIKYCGTLPDIAVEDGSPLLERLYELIELLDDDDRKVLQGYLERRTIAEIAEAVEVSEASVFRQMKKIRATLRELNSRISR